MGDLRLYDESFLMELANKGQDGKEELERKLAMVKCKIVLIMLLMVVKSLLEKMSKKISKLVQLILMIWEE